MPQANDPSGLSQGSLLAVSDAVWGTPTGNQVTITSAGSELPPLDDNEFFEVRDHSSTVNNGLYQVNDASPATNSVTVDKVSGSNPIAGGAEAVDMFSAVDTALTDMVFANTTPATATTANRVDITSALSGLPTMAVGERFEVEAHSDADNNGAYEVITINTVNDDYTCTKLLGVAAGNANEPNDAASEAADTVTERKTIMFDTASNGLYILEQGGIDATGASGQAVYSKTMIDWLDDTFLRANAKFPMRCIDADAGKYLMGQDAGGNNSGWNFVDDADIALGTFGIRTRKLMRNAGWNEIDSAGNITARRAGVLTVDAVENSLTDTAFGMFGTDTTVDNTFDLDFAGPVNEAVEFFKEQAQTDLAITATTITRIGGSFITEGYVVGGMVTIRDAEDAANNGSWVLTGVSALVLTTAGLTINADDTAAILAVDNSNAFRLGMRERDAGDTFGSTFAQADLNTINKSVLGNFVFQFPLKTGSDLKITTTDANMTVSPYDLMTLTMYATPQARGGSGVLVGGPYNFGFIMEGNNGTAEECFEWLQWQLRKLTDIDDDAGADAIGRAIGLLARFVGDTLEVGSADGGLTQTVSPDGGGAGLYIDSLNSSSANDVVFYDSNGVGQLKPIATSVTLDANATLNSDAVSDGILFFTHTIENAVDATFVVTAGTGANGTFVSTAQFPASLNRGVGAYVEVKGLTGIDEPMNGIYQVTALTSTSLWSVTRYDGATIVTTAGEAASIDENPIDTPDAIIVHTNVTASGTDISFTATDTIGQTGIDGVFSVGDFIEIEGSTDNNHIWEVTATPVNELTVVNEEGILISTEGTGPAITISKVVQVPLQVDFAFSFDYSNNVQGGRSGGTTASVKAKAVGRITAQYTESTDQSISTTALIIPLVAQGELNVTV